MAMTALAMRLVIWDLTFDMSGGGQAAKLSGRRPLDGGVRCLRSDHGAFWQPECSDATLRGRTRRRPHLCTDFGAAVRRRAASSTEH